MSIFSKDKAVRLEKKVTLKEKITLWFNSHWHYLLFIIIILFFFFFFLFLFLITPPVESGQYYRFKV